MLRLILSATLICVYINAQKIDCTDDTPCSVYDQYVAPEIGKCDTNIDKCTVTCIYGGQSICDSAATVINEPGALCNTTSNICVPPPSSDPTTTPTLNPTITTSQPTSNPSSAPFPGTAPPTIFSNAPTKQPSSTPSSQPTAAPVCPGSGICSCVDDTPCDAAYTSMISLYLGYIDVGKCNNDIGECTVTCDDGGDDICTAAGSQIGLNGAVCDTNQVPNICHVPPTAEPTTDPSTSPTTSTLNPSIPPTGSPFIGTLDPSIATNPPTNAPSRPTQSPTIASDPPTTAPVCPVSDVCPCDNDAPCDAAYSSQVSAYSESAVCDLTTNECTITCANWGDTICAQAASQAGLTSMTGAICHLSTKICYVPPTNEPSSTPTLSPTSVPTTKPSESPSRTGDTDKPSSSPTKLPTDSPSIPPTKYPTNEPTETPTKGPSEQGMTLDPSSSPSKSPSVAPIACTVATYEACTCTQNPSSTCDILASDSSIAPFIGYLAPDVIECDVVEGQCTATCNNNADTCTTISGMLPGLVCKDGYCRPQTDGPTEDPTLSPTKSPTKSPSDSPTITGFTFDPSSSPSKAQSESPSKSPTKSPTRTGETSPPSKTPTDIPSKSPTNAPTRECSTADILACTCSASDDSNCDILSSDSTIAGFLTFIGESIVCDEENEQCSVTCNTATTCATLMSQASDIFTEELECNSDATPPRCVVVVLPTSDPTKAPIASSESFPPTEAPTDDDSSCAADYFPYNSDCSDTELDLCSLRFDIEVDVCTLNRMFTKYLIKLSCILSLEDIVLDISGTNDVCASTAFALTDLTVTPNNVGASTRARDKPNGKSECPALDTVCDSGNAPGFTLETSIMLYCTGNNDCEDVELVAMQLVANGINLGSLNQVIEDKLKLTSIGEDSVCEDGFGDVDIQSIGITFIDESGIVREIGTITGDDDVDEDNARTRCYLVAMMIVLVVYYFMI